MERFRMAFTGLSAGRLTEADTLDRYKAELVERPYVGCTTLMAYKFQIRTYPWLCAYGRLLYAKNCSAATQAAWSRYDKKGPYKHLREREFDQVKMMAEAAATPFTAAETAALLEQLQMEKAEEYLGRLRRDIRASVRQIILESAATSPIQISLKEEGAAAASGGGRHQRY
jgi:hypothetical protein